MNVSRIDARRRRRRRLRSTTTTTTNMLLADDSSAYVDVVTAIIEFENITVDVIVVSRRLANVQRIVGDE